VLSDVGLVAEDTLHNSGVARPAYAVTGPEGRRRHRCDGLRRARTLLAGLALLAAGESRTASHQEIPARVVAFVHIARRMLISVSFR
jgi:hypothetical protein